MRNSIRKSKRVLSINRIRLEFKEGSPLCIQDSHSRINRIRLEFKAEILQSMQREKWKY